MKVLLIDNSLDNTGASKALIKTISEIDWPRSQFVFLFPKGSKCVFAAREAGFAAHEIGFTEVSKRIKDILFYFPVLFINAIKTRRIIKREAIDIVHVNDIYNMVGLCLKLFWRKKLITHVRRMPESFPATIYKLWSKLHVRYADRIIAVSHANKNALPANKKTTVIYDPLPDDEKLPAYSPRPSLGKKVNVLYLANYTVGKGHQYAIEILARAVKEHPDWNFNLHFFGGQFGMKKNADYKQSLISLSQQRKIASRVCFSDASANVEQTMKDCDVILNLSDSESFSRVTLEALFYGIPIIATDVGGTNEMVTDRQTGILVKRADVESMYQGFRTLIFDDALRVQISGNAYKFVRANFGQKNTVDKLVDVYKTVYQGA